MDFESRFYRMFRDESEFPPPRQVTIKRRKSFSEKFFKSAAGSTLKLSGKSTLRIRKKFMFREKSSSIESLLENVQRKLENVHRKPVVDKPLTEDTEDGDLHSPFSFGLSTSVECLPMSESVDSYLPETTQTSVITLPKFKTLKITPNNKFGTFKRSDLNCSPYGTILRGRINRSRLELRGTEFASNFDPLHYSSPVSHNSSISPSLNSSISSINSVNIENFNPKANYYGQDTNKISLPRTDYSCRVSQTCGKNAIDNLNTLKFLDVDCEPSKQCKQINSPRLTNSTANDLLNDDSFSSNESLKEESSEKDYKNNISNSSSNSQFINDFQKELLSKCSKFRGNLQNYNKESSEDADVNSNTCIISVTSPQDTAPVSKPNISPKPSTIPESDHKTLTDMRLNPTFAKHRPLTDTRPNRAGTNHKSSLDTNHNPESSTNTNHNHKSSTNTNHNHKSFTDSDENSATDMDDTSSTDTDASSKPSTDISFTLSTNSVTKDAFDITPNKPIILPKPEISPKPHIPIKPERLRSIDKSTSQNLMLPLTSQQLPEINNNCIVVNKFSSLNQSLNSTTKLPRVTDLNKNKQLLNQNLNQIITVGNNKSNQIENKNINGIVNRNNKLNEINNQSLRTRPSSSPIYEPLKVRDLVKSFNKVLITSKDGLINNYNTLNTVSDTETQHNISIKGCPPKISKKSFSEWNLAHADRPHDDKYSSVADFLNHKSIHEMKIGLPQISEIARPRSSRTKI